MKIFVKLLAISLALCTTCRAEEVMPCEHVKESITTHLSYYSRDQTADFLKCVSSFRVCAVADDRVVSATLIKHMPDNNERTTVVIVQSPPHDNFRVCLIGSYSGDSAAAWRFEAYKIVNDTAIAFGGMHKAYAQGDVIPPKKAAMITYEMFENYAEKLP